MGVEVRQTLERDYDIQLAMKEVRLLTINSLRDLSSGGASKTENEPTEAKQVDKVEVIGSQVIPHFSDKTLINLNDVNNGQKPLFVLHNINGSVEPLESLASALSCPVIG